MKETQEWTRIKPWFDAFGKAFRIESFTSDGMTDVIFISKTLTFYVELKIIHSEKITVRNSQMILVLQLRHHLKENQHLFVCSEDVAKKPIKVYSGLQLLTVPSKVLPGKKQVLDLAGVQPLFVWNNKQDVECSLFPNPTKEVPNGRFTEPAILSSISRFTDRIRDPDS